MTTGERIRWPKKRMSRNTIHKSTALALCQGSAFFVLIDTIRKRK